MEDHSNRTRLAKLLRFYSSQSDTEQTSLADYVERMKEKQEHIYFIAGTSRQEVENSPFVERLLKKGYEVRILLHVLNQWCIVYSCLKFLNIWYTLCNVRGCPFNTSYCMQTDISICSVREKVAFSAHLLYNCF